jgi:hypothetical protein
VPSDAPVDAEGKPLRFSTDFLPARDRLAIWREVIGRTVARLDLAPLGPGPFRSDTTSRILPDLSVTALSITAVRSQRTRELIADGNDDVLLIRINEGGGLLSHRGREIELGGGQGVIFSNAEVSSVSIPRLSHGLSLRLPRKVLVPLVPHLDDAIMSRIPAANEALQLLASYVAALDRMEGLASPDLREVVSRHLQDLVAAAIGATGENAEIIRQRGVGAARISSAISAMAGSPPNGSRRGMAYRQAMRGVCSRRRRPRSRSSCWRRGLHMRIGCCATSGLPTARSARSRFRSASATCPISTAPSAAATASRHRIFARRQLSAMTADAGDPAGVPSGAPPCRHGSSSRTDWHFPLPAAPFMFSSIH